MGKNFDPARPLKKARWEAFAQLVAHGTSVQEAFAQAGYPPDKANAYRLHDHPEVKARIEWLRDHVKSQPAPGTAVAMRIEAAQVREAEARADKAETQAKATAAAFKSREQVLEELWDNAMMFKGRKPVKVLKALKRTISDEEGNKSEVIEMQEVEETEINATAANQALIAYGKAIGMPFDGTKDADKPDALQGRMGDMSHEEIAGYLERIRRRRAEAEVRAKQAEMAV